MKLSYDGGITGVHGIMAKQITSDDDADNLRKQIANMQTTLSTMMARLAPPALAPKRSRETRTEISPALRRLINSAPEPKRQRKDRNMPSRVGYRCKRATDRAAIEAMQGLTPAAKKIFSYVLAHPALTVPEIAAGVDLREKTVANLLSVMKGVHLIVSEKR